MVPGASSSKKILRRMALEIAECNHAETGIVIIGIKENGAVIAKMIARELAAHFSGQIELSELSIDKKKPAGITLTPDIDVHDKIVLLADDVANSGRTMLYAMKPLLDQRPKQIQTLALVERTHKQFPVALNYKGISLSTREEENIVVEVSNNEVTAIRYQSSSSVNS